MKAVITILIAFSLFSCSKENILEPTKTNEVRPRETTRVSISTFGWMANYRLKYKRASGWVDTVITQQNYSVTYQCFTNELQHPVLLHTIERYDKDTLRLNVTVNTTLTQQAIINKCDAQCVLQPNLAL